MIRFLVQNIQHCKMQKVR